MPATRKPLKSWSITLGENFKELPSHERVSDILAEFFTSGWCFQLEKGNNAQKRHYQCRGVIDPPQLTATILHLFESRGFDRRDVTARPESNKSIEQHSIIFSLSSG